MTGESFREFIHLSYHQIEIRPHDEAGPPYPETFPNGLIAAGPDGAIIVTGLGMGRVEVTVQLADEVPNLAWKGPGFYRLRVHATGRDSYVDGTGLNLEERYAIISWPADPAPDLIHKATDAYGAGVRGRAPQAETTWPTRKNPSGS
ncbi:hypothetical protein GCM10009850_076140 [Nonomuraea monospora]|uniref:Uncharacterized protein n=1 Tax=Nonomuraea monospora TaxID=568818 RepID=A0ABN3CRV3_9ACTN